MRQCLRHGWQLVDPARIAALTGVRAEMDFVPLPVDDPQRRCPDVRLAQEALGWTPLVSADEGLRQTIEWFRLHPER